MVMMLLTQVRRHSPRYVEGSCVMKCERCRAEATSTGPGGQRLCDKHYNTTMAAAPGMVGTGTAADAVGAFIVALPMKIGGGSGAPLRAMAILPPK